MWPFSKRVASVAATADDKPRAMPAFYWRPLGDQSLEGNEAIFGAVTLLSNSLASMRLHLHKGYEIAADHPLERLIAHQPSPMLDAYTWRQTMETCRDTSGNAYALKVRAPDGSIASLDILNPERVEPKQALETGDLWYEVKPQEGGSYLISSQEMIHVRHVSAGGICGVSPIAVLRDTLDYDAQMKTFSIEQAKGIQGAIVLDFPSAMGDAQRSNVIKTFMDQYKLSKGSLLVTSGGVKTSSLNRSPIDAKVLDVDRITANKVARVYNIPPRLLGDYGAGAANSNHEEQQMEFLDRTIIPMVRMYEAQLNRKLLTWQEIADGYHFEFDTDDLLTTNQSGRAALYQSMIRNGIRTPNEIRRRLGSPDAAGGDDLYSSRDLVPLRWLQEHPDKNP